MSTSELISEYATLKQKKNPNTKRLRNNYYCNLCSKSYRRKSTIGNHLKLHKDLRKYRCQNCSKEFI